MKHGRWPGTWRVICDVCGFEFPSDRVKERWDGLVVCHEDFELDHPQKFIRVYENSTPPDPIRPEPTDVFVVVCWLYAIAAYADLAEADCAKADLAVPSYSLLLALKNAGVYN
jgi:hypothetical protein